MDKLNEFTNKYASMQNILIVALIIIVIVFVYREYRGPSSRKSADSSKPSADKLLDQLEQNGAIQQTPSETSSKPPAESDEEEAD